MTEPSPTSWLHEARRRYIEHAESRYKRAEIRTIMTTPVNAEAKPPSWLQDALRRHADARSEAGRDATHRRIFNLPEPDEQAEVDTDDNRPDPAA